MVKFIKRLFQRRNRWTKDHLTVNARIGSQEINGLIREAIKTDPEVQQQIRRVA